MQIHLKKKLNKDNVITIVLILIICLWRIPFLNRGIDYTDTGFNMENYRNVFWGEGIQGIGRFFTIFLGGIIYKLLPAYHLLVYRVLHFLITLATCFFSYKIAEKYIDKNIALLCLLAVSFSLKSGEALFSYYPLTTLLLLISVWLLLDAVTRNKPVKFFLSGFVAGINVFVRLPNLFYFSMILAVIIYFFETKTKMRTAMKSIGLFALGALLSLGATIGFMIAVSGVEWVTESFMGYVRMALGISPPGIENFLGIEETSRHTIFATIRTVAIQVWKSIKSLVFLLPIILIDMAAFNFAKKIKNRNLRYAIPLVVTILMVYILKGQLLASINHTLYIFELLVIFINVIIFFKEKPEQTMLNIMVILLGACSIIGSDAGLTRLGVVRTLLILLVVIAAKDISKKCNIENIFCRVSSEFITRSTIVLIVALYVIGIFVRLPATYNDADFSELNYSVNSEIAPLRGMKTSRVRAEQINEYYSIMSDKALQDKEVAIFGYFPLGIVIGNQHDYFEDVQPCIDYTGVSVKKLLRNIQNKDKNGVEPIIVVSYVNMQQKGTESFTSEAKKAVLDYMLGLYEYEVYSDTENFTVYIPVKIN